MRHPHHLPPNVSALAGAPSADAMGVLIRPEPLQRTCMELGVCQGDGRCSGCAPVELGVCQGDGRCSGCEPVEPPASEPEPLWARWAYTIAMAALYGGTAGVSIGVIKYLADWAGS